MICLLELLKMFIDSLFVSLHRSFYLCVHACECRAVADLPKFVNLELNGNQICEAGVDAIKSVLMGAGKILGGECVGCMLS